MAAITIPDDTEENQFEEVEEYVPSYIYLALYDFGDNNDQVTIEDWPTYRLSWRLIPSLLPTAPEEGHEMFGIDTDSKSNVASDNQYVEDPLEGIRAFIRFPVRKNRSYDEVIEQIRDSSDTLLEDAIDDGWQEWEWVYNIFETLEALDYVDPVTDDWQYSDLPKMDVFKKKILNLAQQVYDWEGSPANRVVDFPVGT